MRLALIARLRAYFFAGILITAPIAITIYLAWLFVSFVDSRVTPLIPARFNPETYLPFAVPGLGVLIVVIALIVIGASTAGYFGRLLTRSVDAAVVRMPVVRSIYVAVKQIMETVLAQKSNAFRRGGSGAVSARGSVDDRLPHRRHPGRGAGSHRAGT